MEKQARLKIKNIVKNISDMIVDVDAIRDKEIDHFNDIPNKYRKSIDIQNRIDSLNAVSDYLYESKRLLELIVEE